MSIFLTVVHVEQSQDTGQAPSVSKLYDNLIPYEDEYGYIYGTVDPSLSFIQLISEAVEDENIQLTESQQADFDFAMMLAEHESAQLQLDSEYEPNGIISYLTKGNAILYGWIPLLLIMILAISIHGEDLENASIVYRTTLPISQWKVLVSKWISLILLGFAYIFFVFIFTILFSLIIGSQWGDWFYPNRYHGSELVIPNYLMLIGIYLQFTLRLAICSAISMTIVTYFRRTTSSIIIVSLGLILLSIFTLYYEPLQSVYNPLHFDYIRYLLGNRYQTSSLGEGLFDVIHTSYGLPEWNFKVSLIYLLLSSVFIALSLFGQQMNLSIKGSSYHSQRLKEPIGISFEYLKLNRLFSSNLLMGSIMVIIVFFTTLMVFQDQSSFDETFSESVKHYKEESIVEAQRMLEEVDKMDSEEQAQYQFMIPIYERTIKNYTYELQLYNQRVEAYQDGQGESFYSTFQPELDAYYDQEGQPNLIRYAGDNPYIYGNKPSYYGYQVSMDRLKVLNDRQIRPIIQSHIQITPYEKLKQSTDNFFQKLSFQDADGSFLGMIYRLLHYYRMDLILLLLILLIAGGGFTVERQSGNHLAWLYTLPKPRSRLLVERITASLMKGFSIIAIFISFIAIISLFREGFGQPTTPIIRYLSWVEPSAHMGDIKHSYTWVNLGTITLQAFLLMIAAISFLVLLSNLISTFFSNFFFTITLVLFLIFGGISLLYLTDFSSLNLYLPFMHLNIMPILSGEFLLEQGMLIDFKLSLLVLTLWSLLLYFILRWRVLSMREIL